jgi:methionyl-tRNA synthetase
MRILTRTIWRAFPELDRFSDEQCERFVKAANARKVPKTITWCVVALVGVLVAAAAPAIPQALLDQLAVPKDARDLAALATPLPTGTALPPPSPLFRKIEIEAA